MNAAGILIVLGGVMVATAILGLFFVAHLIACRMYQAGDDDYLAIYIPLLLLVDGTIAGKIGVVLA